MTGRQHDIVTDRVRVNTTRAILPVIRECGICNHTIAGVRPIFGITPVCASSKCQLAAKAKDAGIGRRAHRHTWFCGLVIAYQGDAKWAVGAVHDTAEKQIDWFKDMTFEGMVDKVGELTVRVTRKTEEELFGRKGNDQA